MRVLAAEFPGVLQAAGWAIASIPLFMLRRWAATPLRLVLDHQAALQLRVMGGDAGWTSVLVTAQRLDAPQENMNPTGRIDDPVGPAGQRQTALAGVTSLPEAMMRTVSRRPDSIGHPHPQRGLKIR